MAMLSVFESRLEDADIRSYGRGTYRRGRSRNDFVESLLQSTVSAVLYGNIILF